MKTIVTNILTKLLMGLAASVGTWLLNKYGITLDLKPLAAELATVGAALIAIWWSHQHIVSSLLDYTPGNEPPANVPKGASGLMNRVFLALLIPVFSLGVIGCTGINDHTHRAFAGAANGWQAGIGENTATGMYELSIKNIDGAGMVLPIFFQTNSNGSISVVVPDAVLSNEKGGKAGLFGSGGGTTTIAFGPQATQTLLGGQHNPINQSYWSNSATNVTPPVAPPNTTTTQTVSNGVTQTVTSAPGLATQTLTGTNVMTSPK